MRSFVEAIGTDEVETTQEHQEFDFDAVERAFGSEPLSPEDSERLSIAMSYILDWLLKVNLNHPNALQAIGKKVIAMAWVLEPSRFKVGDGKQNPSLRQLSKQLGFSAPNISPITAEFSRLTSIFNQFQDHDWKSKPHEHSNN